MDLDKIEPGERSLKWLSEVTYHLHTHLCAIPGFNFGGDMKQITKKYPKAWNDFCQWWGINVKDYNDELEFMDIKFLFGYLVLEFFPKYGIEVVKDHHFTTWKWYIWIKGFEKDQNEWRWHFVFDTVDEAIEKAFEILEKALEEK